MARRRYYRRYVRVAPKKRWASNILQGSLSTSNFGVICENSAGTATPTPVIVKCGNFKVQGDVMYNTQGGSSNTLANLNFFLLFVPEGITPSDALIGTHPEWIMGWKTIDVGVIRSTSETAVAAATFSMSSRLKRNLNSGDKIVAILQSGESRLTANCVFTCQYWTTS